MTTPPSFSVIIPAFNCAHTLARAVQSVTAQTCSDFDIWIVDDGSTDETAQILEPWQGRVNYVYQANQGVAAARNKGVTMSSGQYLAFLDADDWWYPEKLERVAQAIKNRPEVGLFYSQVDFVNDQSEYLWTYRSLDQGDSNYPKLLLTDFVMTSSAVVRGDCFDQVGMFEGDVSPCEDWDLWIRLARVFPSALVPDVLGAYQFAPNAGLTSSVEHWAQAHDRVLDRAFAADGSLTHRFRQRVRGAVAYRKGKIYLSVWDESSALRQFEASVAFYPFRVRSWGYCLLLRCGLLRRLLPGRAKLALHMPEAYLEQR